MNGDRMRVMLKIADLYINLDSYYDSRLLNKIYNYRVSPADRTDIADDVSIAAYLRCDSLSVPEGKKITDRPFDNWYRRSDGGYEVCFVDPEVDERVLKITFDSDCKNIVITALDVKLRFNINPGYLLSNAVETAFSFALLHRGGFCVHASAVVYKNTALAFSAPSGTGKSTHTALWLKNYRGTLLLNDDSPALRPIDGTWYAYGTPWAGTTEINENMRVPLKSLVFLERGEKNEIRLCRGGELIRRFMEAVVCPVSDEMTSCLLSSADSLASNVKICTLKCNMTDDAPETVRRFLYD